MFFKRTDNLTPNITSYDLIKCATVIFMLIDHVGFFFLPEYPWIRVVGRLGFPAWFFLAGYSKSKEISQTLWLGAALLVSGNMVLGQYVFPANALVSYICIRLFMSHAYQKLFSNWEILLYATLSLAFLSLPTNFIFEYGTLAFLFAMFGYAVRNKDELGISNPVRIMFCGFVVVSVSAIQSALFGFNNIQSIVCLVEISAVSVLLFYFRQVEFPKLTAVLPNVVNAVIQFGGRYTLEIYVFHLLAIKAYLLYADYGFYKWFTPSLFPHLPSPN